MKRISTFFALVCFLLCLGMAGWWYGSFSSASVVNWGSGELWASGGKLVMMDQSLNTSPETRFSIRSIPNQAAPAVLTASLQAATLGYHSVPQSNGAIVRNLVMPMWLLAGLLAVPPIVTVVRGNKKQKKAKEKHA